MKCTYCQTKNDPNQKKCSFCCADLNTKRPAQQKELSEDEAYQSQPILATYHTYDLMILLQFLRNQRSANYKLMQDVRKAPETIDIAQDIIKYAEHDYRQHTACVRIIEGILIDRLGYKPKRIDNKLLQAYEKN